jgi:hypothetical protein
VPWKIEQEAHNIVQSRNGKHDEKPHTKYPTVNKSGPSFEPSKWLAPLNGTIRNFQQYWKFGIVRIGSDRT